MVAVGGRFCKETIDPETGKVFWLPHQHGSAPRCRCCSFGESRGVHEPDEVFSVLMKSARVFQDDTLNHFGAGHFDAARQ